MVGVTQKSDPRGVGLSLRDSDMVLIGYLAFLDPPKRVLARPIAKLNQRRRAGQRYSPVRQRGVAAAVCKRWASMLTSSCLEAT